MEFSETALDGPAIGVSTTVDRFTDGWCRGYAGSPSTATIESLPSFSGADFAISCWIKTASGTAARLWRLTDSSSRHVLSVEGNEAGNMTVLVSQPATALLVAGNDAAWADEQWHHVLVQRRQQTLQLFLDGVMRGSHALPSALAAPAVLQLGNGWAGEIDDVRLHTRAFNASEAAALVYAWRQFRQSNRADSMAGYFPFYGNARNDTGIGIDGVVQNALPTSNRFGDSNGAYEFNGLDSAIQLREGFDTYEEDYAVAFWFVTSSVAAMVALSTDSPRRSFKFVVNGDAGLGLHVSGEAPLVLATGSSGAYADSKWHFAVAQRQGAELQLYVDGVLKTSTQDHLPLLRADGPMAFGRGPTALTTEPGAWKGKLDDIHVYARSFTPQELKTLEGLQFRPMDGAAALTFNGRLWLLGGWRSSDTPTTHSEVWCSDDGRSWSLASIAPWQGRHTFAAVVFDGRMWVIGGDRNRGYYQSDVWSSRDGVSWQLMGDAPPWAGRACPYAVAFNGRIWLMGGVKAFEPTENQGAYNDIYSSADGVHWTLENAHAPWSPRGLILGSVVHRGSMWLIGGGQYDQRTFLNDVWNSTDGVNWTLVCEHAPWSGRVYHSVLVFDGKIWVIAGADAAHPGGTTDAWFSVDGMDWVQLQNTPWRARHAPSAFGLGNSLYLIAGSEFQLFNDIWSLSFAP